jgi:hypothetical protein
MSATLETSETLDLCNAETLRSLEARFESERKRTQGWWSTTFKATKYGDTYLFCCKRLAIIREQLKLLAETYE